MNYIGKNIRRLRQKKGWSQSQVAAELKISVPAFSKIETGHHRHQHIETDADCQFIQCFCRGHSDAGRFGDGAPENE